MQWISHGHAVHDPVGIRKFSLHLVNALGSNLKRAVVHFNVHDQVIFKRLVQLVHVLQSLLDLIIFNGDHGAKIVLQRLLQAFHFHERLVDVFMVDTDLAIQAFLEYSF